MRKERTENKNVLQAPGFGEVGLCEVGTVLYKESFKSESSFALVSPSSPSSGPSSSELMQPRQKKAKKRCSLTSNTFQDKVERFTGEFRGC